MALAAVYIVKVFVRGSQFGKLHNFIFYISMAGYRMLTACLLGNSCAPQALEMEPTSVRAGAQAVHFTSSRQPNHWFLHFLKVKKNQLSHYADSSPVECHCHKWIWAGSGSISLKGINFPPSTLDMVTLRIVVFWTRGHQNRKCFMKAYMWVLHRGMCRWWLCWQ